jgi:hypothetical protein
MGILLHRLSLHRVARILAEQRSVCAAKADCLRVCYARRNRRRLRAIAESLIFGYDSPAFTRPPLCRLAPTELTSQGFERSLA